ncbi:hypothetical protein MMC27_001204 [Xylographa pallens]|nr:hypothetical protein [Xylographa pallens]
MSVSSNLYFMLFPIGKIAEGVVNSEKNAHLLCSDGGLPALAVGLGVGGSSSQQCLATIGRGHADITINMPYISRTQCSFEVDRHTGNVMLWDRSSGHNTHILPAHPGQEWFPFEPGRPRKVHVSDRVNTRIGFGDPRCKIVQFQLFWNKDRLRLPAELFTTSLAAQGWGLNPCDERTFENTMIHTPDTSRAPRYLLTTRIGRGAYGEVYKATDIDSFRLLAVKIQRRPKTEASIIRLKREIEAMSIISHPHIIDYLGSNTNDENIYIFMGLKDGSYANLVEQSIAPSLSRTVLRHMLGALDFLTTKSIVHRDVKPENILFTTSTGGQNYSFRLSDFGLCNAVDLAVTYAGTETFMAPEVLQKTGQNQTTKVDVWSLWATIVWGDDMEGFRTKRLEDAGQAIAAIAAAASKAPWPLQMMGVIRPEERASAAQILVGEFEAKGLTTPRGKIPPLMPLAVSIRSPSPQNLTPVPVSEEYEDTTEFELEVANDFRFDRGVHQAFAAATANERRRPGSKQKNLDSGIKKREPRKRASVVKRSVAGIPHK